VTNGDEDKRGRRQGETAVDSCREVHNDENKNKNSTEASSCQPEPKMMYQNLCFSTICPAYLSTVRISIFALHCERLL
jgi:hypothetical protein